ncbi:MAG: HIT domain-containing protein [Pseudomonadota bacterium]|jgi:diadenosine tetraphosphate (Ap4A) HIT family hydrolase
MADFELHPRLAADTRLIGDLALCRVLLMDDARFPWLILVPRRPGLVELTDLADADATQLMDETRRAARALGAHCTPHKLNLGALGNQVPQFHLHAVARFPDDARWPQPVWGAGPAERYGNEAAARRIRAMRDLLGIG